MSTATPEQSAYLEELLRCTRDRVIDRESLDRLHELREAAGITGEEHTRYARAVRRALKERNR